MSEENNNRGYDMQRAVETINEFAREVSDLRQQLAEAKAESHGRLEAVIIMRQALYEISCVDCKNKCNKVAKKALKEVD